MSYKIPGAKITKFTGNGSWTLDPSTTALEVYAWGGGAGGGSGRSGASGAASGGGGGGGGGAGTLSGQPSGAGGAGARGQLIIIEYM